MQSTTNDTCLPPWREVRDKYEWTGILIGNGASCAIWPGFHYSNLYAKAIEFQLLTGPANKLFKQLGTQNFEQVLRGLSTTITVLRAFGKPTRRFQQTYDKIKHALVKTVKRIHMDWPQVQDRLDRIRAALRKYEFVYSTNYDLLIYWSIMSNPEGFVDFFWTDNCVFDPSNTSTPGGKTKVVYVHGALPLEVLPDGRTKKKVRGHGQNLLNQFGALSEPGARPLVVTEGGWKQKLDSILGNAYLSFVYQLLGRNDRPLVIFGHGLRNEDKHLVSAISKWKHRPIAVSIRPQSKSKIIKRKKQLAAKFPYSELWFFDARTHPLGRRELLVD